MFTAQGEEVSCDTPADLLVGWKRGSRDILAGLLGRIRPFGGGVRGGWEQEGVGQSL